MAITSGHSLRQTKHRHGFLTKCSKLTKLWFVDRRKKGINLILDRNSDKWLENIFWTWGVSTLSPCPELGTAHAVMLQPVPGTPWYWTLWVHSKAEMSWSSPRPCPQRGCGCAGTAVLCDQGILWDVTSGSTTANGGQQKCHYCSQALTITYPSKSKMRCPACCQILVF